MTNDLIEAQTVPQDDGFGLTAVTRLYHAKLHRLAKEMGTQKAVAKYLGVSSCLFNQWVNLKNLPPKEPHNRGGRLWKKQLLTYAREEAARLEAVDPTKSAEVSELRESLIRALKHLSYREREIIKLRFGIDYDQAFTLQECAHIFKMTRERARQIQRKAIRKMQSYAPELAQHLPAGDDGNVDTDECEHLRKWDEWDEIHR